MLGLTDQQMTMVKEAVAMLPAPDRDHFLRSLASRLRHPFDAEVESAIRFILGGHGLAGGAQIFQIGRRA